MTKCQTLESNARRAQGMNSFREYKDGSATAEYLQFVQRAENAAAEALERLTAANAPQERAERIGSLLESYKNKKLAWLEQLHANAAAVPSVMISGAGNFPVKQKQRQIERDRSIREGDPEYLVGQIESIGSGAKTIRSDEENAPARIKERIKELEVLPDKFGNNAANIRRLKERLFTLAPDDEMFQAAQENITVNGCKTYAEIVKLWETGKVSKSTYDPESNRNYYYLALDFYNGQRHYKDLLSLEVDESGQHMLKFNLTTSQTDKILLTDELKYRLIVGKINGSGNKKIMYNYLLNLAPSVQAAKEKAEAEKEGDENKKVTINGESAEVIENTEAVRLQLMFEGKPSEATRNTLKSNGFRWAPSMGAWQRMLNANARHALSRIADKA